MYGEIHAEPRGCPAPTDDAAWYLAKHIDAAAREILKRPAKAMDFIRDLAKECADKGEILQWRSPTGFPCANRYFESEVKTLHLGLRGEYVRHNVAVGYKTSLDEQKCKNSAAPNFVHSLDASHGIRVINTAAGEGISVAFVHDSFGCLAPHAERLHHIIRDEMARMYDSRDVLDDLRAAAGSSLKPPEKGTLNPRSVQDSTYAFA